jgi:NAD(P)-dependent dehydrogenase (short-subunit alcohol dehydrogenase family)
LFALLSTTFTQTMGDFSLTDKVILVTGGTGILGDAFIKGIVQAGGTVGILGRNQKIAAERADAVNAGGGKAIALIADVLMKLTLLLFGIKC